MRISHSYDVSDVTASDKHGIMHVLDSMIDNTLSYNEAVKVLKAQVAELSELYEAVSVKQVAGSVDEKVYRHVNACKSIDGKVVHKNVNNMDVRYFHDSASNAHMMNNIKLAIPGTIRDCNVIIGGVSDKGEDTMLHAYQMGDVYYNINEKDKIILKGVLICEDADIGSAGDKRPCILVSTSKMTKDNHLGIHFVAGGDHAELVRDGNVLHRFSVNKASDQGMYTDIKRVCRKAKVSKRSKESDLDYHWRRACLAWNELNWADEYDKTDSGDADDADSSSNDKEKENKNEKCQSYESSQKAKLDQRKLARKNGSTKKKKEKLEKVTVVDEDVRDEANVSFLETALSADAPKNSEDEAIAKDSGSKSQPKLSEFKQAWSKGEKLEFAKLIHRRVHNGNTQPILKFFKRAFGDEFPVYMNEVLKQSCDGCAFAKSFEKHPHHESTRKAKCIGERLHFDVFTAPWRSDTGCKYLLVVIDEYSSYIWTFGMKRKSETMTHITDLITSMKKRCESRMTISTHNGMYEIRKSGGVQALRCDNAGENVLHDMKEWCRQKGITMETSVPETPYQNGRLS